MAESECHDGEFKCLIHEECIPEMKRCDGTKDCEDNSDEWYECGITQRHWLPLDLEVRLMYNEEESVKRGRVEVRRRGFNEDFGTVCGEGWTTEDAAVVCRMLNQQFVGNAYAYNSAVFGEGGGDISMSNVGCNGNESNLGDCKSRGFGYGLVHCSHAQDAGVTCDGSQVITSPPPQIQGPESDVRLIRGSSCLSGLLQVYHKEEWRFVCNTNFGSPDATVVCRTLGFNAGKGYLDYFGYFGFGDGLYWLDNLDCHGNESHIFNCTSNPFGENNCNVNQAVGLFCSGQKELDCENQKPCISSINCSFESDDCCYGFISPEIEGKGTTPWVRYNAGQITLKDHTTQHESGYIAYYQNIYGNKNDFAYLDLPNITLQDHNQKLEFYYLITSNCANALSLNLVNAENKVTNVWKPTPVTKEIEGMWIYGCFDIEQHQDKENGDDK
ncbi:deleted in malignant brain tumors 1 protein-like [Ruditapes philippinarum]|uniref:deleted in malignant brain tumors 1 protein-like n=1 Tax=Ruditapes philippinarum TaxID=129788 RepID=UPI00295A6635|nr:deleted in malignant brain tumors 1 protein-like [Ruditapes philippinarum]